MNDIVLDIVTYALWSIPLLLVIFLVWLRWKPNRSARLSKKLENTLTPRNPVRRLSSEFLLLGIYGVLLALFDRVKDAQGRVEYVASAEPSLILLLLASYILLVAVVFLISGARVGLLFLGTAGLLTGVWNLVVGVVILAGGQQKIFSDADKVTSQFPAFLFVMGVWALIGGGRIILAYFFDIGDFDSDEDPAIPAEPPKLRLQCSSCGALHSLSPTPTECDWCHTPWAGREVVG